MGKLNKLSLPVTILIACIILGGFYYVIEINKQKSIEKQQQIELQVKIEQDRRGYIAKRKTDCLAIYKTESDKWSNVQGWQYNEPLNKDSNSLSFSAFESDTCEIIYKDNKTGENFSKYY